MAPGKLELSGMPSVAEQLRQAREARNLSLQQVAEVLKIRTDHLQALEAGDFKVFSAPVYIKGFVRAYSRLLKLDVAQVMSALDGELGQVPSLQEPPSLTGESRPFLDFVMLQLSKINLRKALVAFGMLVGLAVVVLFALAIRHHYSSDPLKDLPAPLYQKKPNTGDTLPVPRR